MLRQIFRRLIQENNVEEEARLENELAAFEFHN